jgi:ferritin-like metal-binding protein YciE
MNIDSLDTLLREELKDIYDAEKRLVRAIPKMAKKVSSDDLKAVLTEHLEVTRNQVARLEHIFEILDVPAKGKTCAGMKGIIEEGEETLEMNAEDFLLDTAIIGAAQRVEHYEMAAYASARLLAENIGNGEVADLLQQTWSEEQEADEKLAEIAGQILADSRDDSEPAQSAATSKKRISRASRGA